MGEKLPVLTPSQVVSLLKKQGFSLARQKGSHMQFKHRDGRFTTVPMHQSRDISPSLLRKICRDIHVSPEEFIQ